MNDEAKNETPESGSMVMSVRSGKTLEQVCEDLPYAVTKHKFGIMSTHDLKATMAKKGVEFDRECRVYEVCNPHQAKKVLEANMEISTALPCRISIYREGDHTVLSTIRPSGMLEMFGAGEAAAVAQEVEHAISNIMEDAAAG